jgi:NADH:ubiquinone oxidoreductase subunit D
MTHSASQKTGPSIARFSTDMTFWLPHDMEMLADVVAIIGTQDIVFGEIDR